MSQYGQQPPYGDGGYQQQPGYQEGPPPGYPPPGYQQPGYPPPGYPGYPPPGYGVPMGGPPPPNHLARAIVAIFFFWPLAIAAIVKSTQVESLWARGDYYGAQAASESARKYANICFYISIAWIAFVLFAVVIGVVASSSSNSTSLGVPVRALLGV